MYSTHMSVLLGNFFDWVHVLWTTRGEFLSSCGVSTNRASEVCKIANSVWSTCGVGTRGL